MSRNKRERKASMSAPVLLNLSSDPITAIPGSNELEEFEDRPTILQRLRANWIIVAVVGIAALGVFGSTLKYLEEDATRQSPTSTKSGSILARLNPITPPPPTTQLSKEYIYAGSRLLAVEDANANAAPPADLAVWRSGDGNWHVMGGTGSAQTTYNWGSPGDIPTQGDYDGDGKTDFAIYRPGSSGQFYLVRSSDGSMTSHPLGSTGDVPAPADFDGDGKTDFGIYRPSDGSWHVLKSSSGAYMYPYLNGTTGTAAPADYDGDGLADAAVLNGSTFTARLSSNGQLQTISMGASGTPVSGDYDGDGKANYAVRSGASWLIMNAALTATTTTTPSGDISTDTPVPNDYDGDGKCDIATFRTSPQGFWYIRQSSNGQTRAEQWGYQGDIPVPAYFRR